jgi:2-iminobutanoate/2-iminopropanoate deaminase
MAVQQGCIVSVKLPNFYSGKAERTKFVPTRLEGGVSHALKSGEACLRKTMFKHLTPSKLRPPFARYSHAVEVTGASRLVFCSGQLGIGADENVPEEAGAQAERCFANIAAILEDGGLSLKNIVRINAYVTDRAYMQPYMTVRDRLFADPAPASTLMIVSGFTREIFKVEIEVVAAA